MKKLLIVLLLQMLLTGCIYLPHNGYGQVYHYPAPHWPVGYQAREVIPYRNNNHIGYIDHNGNLHLWPAN